MKKIIISALFLLGFFMILPQTAHACGDCGYGGYYGGDYYDSSYYDGYYGDPYNDSYSGGYYGYGPYGDDSWYNFGGYEPDTGWRTLPYYLLSGINAWMQDRAYGSGYGYGGYDPYYGSDPYGYGPYGSVGYFQY